MGNNLKKAIIGGALGAFAVVLTVVAVTAAFPSHQAAQLPTNSVMSLENNDEKPESTEMRPSTYYDDEAKAVFDNAITGTAAAADVKDSQDAGLSNPKVIDFSGLTTSYSRKNGWTPTITASYRIDETAQNTDPAGSGSQEQETPIVEGPFYTAPAFDEWTEWAKPPRAEILFESSILKVNNFGRVNFRNGNVVFLDIDGSDYTITNDGITFYNADGTYCNVYDDGTIIGRNFSMDPDGNLLWYDNPDEVVSITPGTTVNDRWQDLALPGEIGNYTIPDDYFDPIPEKEADAADPVQSDKKETDAPESGIDVIETTSSDEEAVVVTAAVTEDSLEDDPVATIAVEPALTVDAIVSAYENLPDAVEPSAEESVSTAAPAPEADVSSDSGDPVLTDTLPSESDALPGEADEVNIAL